MADSEDIIVPLPDGRRARFPKGTAPEVIEATIARLAAPNPSAGVENSAAAPPATAATAPAGSGAPKPGALADNFLSRAVRGALVNRVDPAAEMLVRGVNAIGLVPDSEVANVQRINAERRALHEASRERVGDTGFDAAATTGTAALDMAALGPMMRLLGKPHLANPRSLIDLAKAGGVAGGTAGLLSPVEGSEEMSNPRLAWEKAKQIGVGGGAGALAAPLGAVAIDKTLGGVRDVATAVARGARRAVAPTTAQQAVNDPRSLEAYLMNEARQVGVDWARVPEAMKNSLREATRRATTVTGALPADAVRNRLVAEAEGLPQLTVGQSTRDPMQFSREANSPDEELRALFQGQRTAATERLGTLSNRYGAPRTDYELGTAIEGTVASQAAQHRAAINALYNVARDKQGGYQVLQNTTDFAKEAVRELKKQQLWEDLPASMRGQLQLLTSDGGRYKLTARQAVQLLQNINGKTTDMRDPTNAALGLLKSRVNDLLDAPQFRDAKTGEDVIAAFRAASARRAEMGRWEDSSAAIKELAKRNPRIATERIFDRYVIGGSVDDFAGLWNTLPSNLQNGVRRQFIDEITARAMNRTATDATNFGSATKMLREYPREKLDLMFSRDELRSLRNTLEYLRLTTEAPAGSFVNRSNSLVDLKDLLSNTQNVPLLGPTVSGPLRKMVEANEARNAATSGGLFVASDPAPLPALVQSGIRRSPGAYPAVGAGAVGAGISEDDER